MSSIAQVKSDMLTSLEREYAVTPGKICELVDRIVAEVDPIAIIAFGSRARGDHRPDSDLDLAVIVDGNETDYPKLPPHVRDGIRMSVDLLTIPEQRYERFRPWINTVHRQIDRQGVRLYERGRQSPDRSAFERLCA